MSALSPTGWIMVDEPLDRRALSPSQVMVFATPDVDTWISQAGLETFLKVHNQLIRDLPRSDVYLDRVHVKDPGGLSQLSLRLQRCSTQAIHVLPMMILQNMFPGTTLTNAKHSVHITSRGLKRCVLVARLGGECVRLDDIDQVVSEVEVTLVMEPTVTSIEFAYSTKQTGEKRSKVPQRNSRR